jgi:hypothetical protein
MKDMQRAEMSGTGNNLQKGSVPTFMTQYTLGNFSYTRLYIHIDIPHVEDVYGEKQTGKVILNPSP